MSGHYLRYLFEPRSIAVFGASDRDDSVAGTVLRNLLQFAGQVDPINPAHQQVAGRRCYADIAQLPGVPDLAVIATPATTVPKILRQCGERGVKAAIVHSSGFRDEDARGATLRTELIDTARRFDIALLGPNCLGLMRPSLRLNASFSHAPTQTGNLALVSQSGALCSAIVDWATEAGIGFSTVVSLGDAALHGFGDMLDYLATDAQTHSILLYVEGIRRARRFMSGLRVAARLKPVVALKAGRHQTGAQAARSHTGALVGADDVFAAALRRAGAVRATTVEQLFAAAQLLAEPRRMQGNRLAIVSNAGGPGVMAADRAADLGVDLAQLSDETLKALNATLPPQWSHGNPVDVMGDAPPARYGSAMAACLDDANVDGVLVMLSPQAMTDPNACANAVAKQSAASHKPVVSCWMGGAQVTQARATLRSRSVPTFESPETAVDAFAFLCSHRRNQELLLQVPEPLGYEARHDVSGARLILESVLSENRQVLTSSESKAVLRAFGIPVSLPQWARSPNEALIVAETLGFPVAMKIDSPDITHKADVGGVRLDIRSAEEVRACYTSLIDAARAARPDARIDGVTLETMHRPRFGRELLVGAFRDVAFGPAIAFGAGGTLVEVIGDRAVALPPLNAFMVSDMIGRTRVAASLGTWRGMAAVNREALQEVLQRVSDLVCELPHIRELDINPLVCDEQGAVALDARIAVARPVPGERPYSHMAIHPYPGELQRTVQLPDGANVVVRPIRPEDAQNEQRFLQSLSDESKYFRFMKALDELTPTLLVRFTQIDYDREMAFVGVVREGDRDEQIGVSRYVTNPDGRSCEFALVVADRWQGRGIGTLLMQALIDVARQRGLEEMQGEILTSNRTMFELVTELGFTVQAVEGEDSVRRAVKHLD